MCFLEVHRLSFLSLENLILKLFHDLYIVSLVQTTSGHARYALCLNALVLIIMVSGVCAAEPVDCCLVLGQGRFLNEVNP